MRTLVLLLGIFLFSSFKVADAPFIDKAEARSAFEFLNKMRTDAHAFFQTFHLGNSFVLKTRPALKWNDTLAHIAEAKALDMAKRHYFEHVDPDGFGMNHYINLGGYKLDSFLLEDPKENNFESIAMNAANGKDAIIDLIIDSGVPSLGHRKHLLGIDDLGDNFNSSLVDIGIGFAKSNATDTCDTYVSILIAKHTF